MLVPAELIASCCIGDARVWGLCSGQHWVRWRQVLKWKIYCAAIKVGRSLEARQAARGVTDALEADMWCKFMKGR